MRDCSLLLLQFCAWYSARISGKSNFYLILILPLPGNDTLASVRWQWLPWKAKIFRLCQLLITNNQFSQRCLKCKVITLIWRMWIRAEQYILLWRHTICNNFLLTNVWFLLCSLCHPYRVRVQLNFRIFLQQHGWRSVQAQLAAIQRECHCKLQVLEDLDLDLANFRSRSCKLQVMKGFEDLVWKVKKSLWWIMMKKRRIRMSLSLIDFDRYSLLR